MKYDRSSIMREANRLRIEEGFTRKAALKKAWEQAREQLEAAATRKTPQETGRTQQETGLRAAARRYGLDRLTERAQRAVAEAASLALRSARQAKPLLLAVAANAQRKPETIALGDLRDTIEYKRGADGVWRAPQ